MAQETQSITLEQFPLVSMRSGQRGRVCRALLEEEDCELLRAMGICEESEVRMCKVGRACIVQVNATRLGISRELASRIMITRHPIAS